jgi:polysaccharide export outer membrane protein
MKNTFLALFLVVAVFVSGCATHGRRSGTIPTSQVKGGNQPAFSDEVSRDIVRQTRQLLVLRDTDYRIGPDDVLEISIFEWELSEQTKTLEFRVAQTGVISLPSIGVVHVGDKSVQDIQTVIERQLSEKGVLQNPRVGVAVKEFRSRRIAVIGEVNQPGVYAIQQNVTTLMDMLTLAGGPTRSAGQIAHILRKEKGRFDPVRITVSLKQLFEEGKFDLNAVLQGDDIVFIPNAPLMYVYGSVRAPGGYTLNRSIRALEAVALAGGLQVDADKRNCFLVRRDGPMGIEQVISLDLLAIERGKQQDVFLQEGDVLHIPDSPTLIAISEIWGIFKGIFTFTYRLDSN